MRVEELPLQDPGQDGPPWVWTGLDVPPEVVERERRKFAERMLQLQRQFCLSGDPIHALTAATWCQLYHTAWPPWVEQTVVQLAWVVIMANGTVRGRLDRYRDWARFVAVTNQLRWQREAGVKKPNKRVAFEKASKDLRGQLGRGSPQRVEASYRRVNKAIKRRGGAQFIPGQLDNRYPTDIFGREHARPPWM